MRCTPGLVPACHHVHICRVVKPDRATLCGPYLPQLIHPARDLPWHADKQTAVYDVGVVAATATHLAGSHSIHHTTATRCKGMSLFGIALITHMGASPGLPTFKCSSSTANGAKSSSSEALTSASCIYHRSCSQALGPSAWHASHISSLNLSSCSGCHSLLLQEVHLLYNMKCFTRAATFKCSSSSIADEAKAASSEALTSAKRWELSVSCMPITDPIHRH